MSSILNINAQGVPATSSTSTFPDTTTANRIIYSSSNNVVSQITSANNGVLATNGSGVPSISSSIPSAVTLPASSGASMVLIQTQTASNSSSIDFTGLSTYADLMIHFRTVTPVSDGEALLIRVSTNNGSSYDTTGYTGGVWGINYDGTGFIAASSTAGIPLTIDVDNGNDCTGFVIVSGTGTADLFRTYGNCTYFDNSDGKAANATSGGSGTTGVNAIRFLFGSGNISNGTFTLYGIKSS